MVAPTPTYRIIPKHGLEAAERHPERTDGGVPPIANAREVTRLLIHVNVVLDKVGMVGHQRPIGGQDPREHREQLVQRWAKALWQPCLELGQFR